MIMQTVTTRMIMQIVATRILVMSLGVMLSAIKSPVEIEIGHFDP